MLSYQFSCSENVIEVKDNLMKLKLFSCSKSHVTERVAILATGVNMALLSLARRQVKATYCILALACLISSV